MTNGTLRVCSVGLVAVALVGACGGAEPGSREDLHARIEAIGLPSGMVELDHFYRETCPGACPSLVVWYQVTAPAEQTTAELTDALARAGWDVNEVSARPGVFSASNETHLVFVVTDKQMIAGNVHAPEGTHAEISIHHLRGSERLKRITTQKQSLEGDR